MGIYLKGVTIRLALTHEFVEFFSKRLQQRHSRGI